MKRLIASDLHEMCIRDRCYPYTIPLWHVAFLTWATHASKIYYSIVFEFVKENFSFFAKSFSPLSLRRFAGRGPRPAKRFLKPEFFPGTAGAWRPPALGLPVLWDPECLCPCPGSVPVSYTHLQSQGVVYELSHNSFICLHTKCPAPERENAKIQICLAESGPSQVCPSEVRPSQVCASEVRPSEVCLTEICPCLLYTSRCV